MSRVGAVQTAMSEVPTRAPAAWVMAALGQAGVSGTCRSSTVKWGPVVASSKSPAASKEYSRLRNVFRWVPPAPAAVAHAGGPLVGPLVWVVTSVGDASVPPMAGAGARLRLFVSPVKPLDTHVGACRALFTVVLA